MKRVKFLLIALMTVLATLSVAAQNIKVSGTVTDPSGQPLIGASVILKGSTSVGTMTDFNGYYALSVPANGTIIASMVGYETQEKAIAKQAKIDFVLAEDAEFLDNAIVVGYGSAKRPGSLVGSVTTVKEEAIKNNPSSSALDKLQGQVAGLAVMTTGGVAGDNAISMTLHGDGSLGASSTPLYLVDGVPVSARTIMAMNPNDIASISVNKDASATSIYGARAANGVIYIATKNGGFNSEATVTIRSQYGTSTLANWSLYENMMSGDELKKFWLRTGIHDAQYIKEHYTDKGYDANTKWYKVLQKEWAPQYQNDISVEGGSSRISYMIGLSQHHEEGTTIGNYYDRYTLRSNIQARPKDWLKLGLNMNLYMDGYARHPYWSSNNGGSNAYSDGGLSYLINPLYPYIDPITGQEYVETYPDGSWNSWTMIKYQQTNYKQYGVTGSFYAQIEPVRNLIFKTQVGLDGDIRYVTGYRLPTYFAAAGNGTRNRTSVFEYTAQITNTLEYSFNIADDHDISILIGQEGIQEYYDSFGASGSKISEPRLNVLQSTDGSSRSITESYQESRFLSFFGHIDYSLFNRYLLDVTVRNDASSRFGANNRNALFWSVGAKWRAKRENFLKDVTWVNDLNVKVSYGTQGNAAITDYAALAKLGAAGAYNQETSSLIVSSPANPGLTWEKQGLFTIGIEGKILNFIDFDFQVYDRKTSSMLMSIPYPYTSGFSSMTANVGGLSNRGVDITLGFDILRNRDYFFRLSGTFNYNQEKVTELFQGLDRWAMSNYGYAYVVGQPVMYYAAIYAGVDPEDGRQMWYLPGENPDVTTMDPSRVTKTYTDDLEQNTGMRLHAPIYGGFSVSGGWKGFTVQADFSYVLGKTLLNNDMYFYANPWNNTDNTQIKDISDFWTPTNRNAKWPDWTKGETVQFDTHIYENASFLRLKALQVGYSLPESLLKNQKVFKGVRISFTGRNLLTATKYSGIDPEVDSNLSIGMPGNTKQFVAGLELTF